MSQENQETNSDTYSSVDVPSSSSKKSDNFDFNDSSLVHTTFSYGDSGGSLLPTDSKVTSTKSFNNLNNLEDTTVFKKSWGNTQGFGFGHENFDPYNKDDEDALDPLPIPTEVSSQQKSNSPQNLATQMNTSESARDRPKAPPVPPPPAPPNPTSHRMIDVDNPEFSEIEDLPHQMVVNFHDMVNRTKWTIPLAPKEPFQILLESAISVVNKGLDRNSQNMATFLQTAVKAFERLLGEDVRRWNCEIQEYIWQAIVLFLRLFASKLRRTATDPDFPQEYFLIFSSVMNPHTSYHLHNTNRGIERLEIKIEPLIVEQFTTLNIENLKPDARFKLLAYAFAKFGGCDGMMEFLKTHVKEGVELEIVLLWLRGLSYKTVLKPRVLEKITEHALRYSIQQIQKIPESEWKCADVKENLHDLPFLQFIRTVQAILIIIAEDKPNEWIRQLDVIQLKYLLSVIQQAKLSGRLRAMEELNRLICEKGRNLESQPVQLALNITKNFSELMNWLRENQLIELLLRDNLHLPNFVDRLEKIFQAFLKEEVFELSDLEAIWQAQVGKHDVIQRNLHGLVASLAANFERPSQEVILDDLCVKIRESWAIASNREKSLLVDLIGKIVERSSRSEHLDQVIIPKTTELLWNLFQDKTLSQETIDLVLKSHYDIIDSARNSDDIRQEYINLCFEEIKKDSEFVVPILRHLQLLLKTKYTTWNQEKKLVKEEHVKIICQSIETYTKKMREFLNNNPHVTHQLPNISFDGKYSHFVHLQQRIDFLTFILEEGRELRVFGEKDQSSWLKMEYIKILWKSLIKNPLTDEDSRVGFELFAKQIPNLYEFDRILSFFNDCVLALDPRRLSERGLECFKTSLHTIKMKTTEKLVELEMKALEYLWQIVLEANLEVSTLATNLLVESLLIENTFSTPPPADKDINEFIQNCFTKLKQHYEWLTKEETSKQLKLKEMERMSRILKVLHFSVEQVDQKYDSERVRLPLYRATIGQCFSVKLLLTVDDLKSALENIQEVFDVDIEDNDLRHLKEHNIPVEVHDNMTLEYFKRYVVKEAIYQLPIIPKNPTRYVPSFQLMWHKPETELTRTNSNSMFTSPSVSEWKTLDGSDLRKTFREIYANAFCNNQFSVTFDTISPWSKPKRAQKLLEKQKSKRVNMGDDDFSSDVSLESSDSEFSYEDLEEIPPTEALLPSFQIADNREYMEFLTNLIDLGKDCEDSELAIEARRLLSLLPIHMKIEQDLEAMAKNNTLMNIFSNSPSCTSHYFEVIEALILPARCIKKVKQSGSVFQGYFLCNNGLDQLLLALNMISVNFDREMLRTPINCLKFIEDFKIQLEALRAFMMISWSASMGKMVLINHIDTPIVIRNEDALFLKYLNGDETNMCELLSIEAIEAFCLGLLSCDQMHRVVAPPTAKTSSDNIYTFLVDVLFTTDSELIRGVLITAALCIVQHCGPGESARAQFLIDLLFDNIDNVEEKTTSCASAYFSLLCRLVELCSSMFNLKINHLNNRIQLVLLWIEQAKQISSAQAESYPKDILLTGYLNLAAAMFRQLSPEEKSKLGSSVDGPQLIKMLFDEFLFPYSRSFLEMNAMDLLEQRGETSTGGSPYNLQSIQRSATYAGINQPGSSSMMPRSATVAHISRWVPVCGTDSSQKAAFDLIHELSYDNPQNFEVVFKTLVQIFYHKPFPTKIEWDYMPSFIPRGPSNFVGLKNAGATCYMNSVFQQMFMVESIRNAIINAPCGASLDLDSEENTRLSGGDKDEYVIQVLQSVQAIFAHLLGSDLQYYEPRSFWNTFMLNGTRVNLREQQDALEFFNQLTDAVDQGMKKVCDDPIFEKTFGGTFADQKICKDCPHRYEKEHLFTSISVDIRSHNSLADSLKEYVKGEILDNDNAYL
uniref:USP domain-containing protein n=1 Tax=Acrobeloides nanus TaxID=290746 RepID=A0A914CZY1_9BILA